MWSRDKILNLTNSLMIQKVDMDKFGGGHVLVKKWSVKEKQDFLDKVMSQLDDEQIKQIDKLEENAENFKKSKNLLEVCVYLIQISLVNEDGSFWFKNNDEDKKEIYKWDSEILEYLYKEIMKIQKIDKGEQEQAVKN